MPAILVDENTQLSYVDSGPPKINTSSYVTFFAVHGIIFTSSIFSKVMSLAPSAGIRIVAINRRGYADSSPLPDPDPILTHGTDEQKMAYLAERGIEIATFVDSFIQLYNLPAISEDGESGGVVLLGWSLGCSFTLSAVANLDKLPKAVRRRLALYMKVHIMQSPGVLMLGLPMKQQQWSFIFNIKAAGDRGISDLEHWLSGHFAHSNLSSRDVDTLANVPDSQMPISMDFPAAQPRAIIKERGGAAVVADLSFMLSLGPQLLSSFRKGCFDRSIRRILPRMITWMIAGEADIPITIAAFWSVESEDDANGGGLVKCKLVHNADHCMQWKNPDETIAIYCETVTGPLSVLNSNV